MMRVCVSELKRKPFNQKIMKTVLLMSVAFISSGTVYSMQQADARIPDQSLDKSLCQSSGEYTQQGVGNIQPSGLDAQSAGLSENKSTNPMSEFSLELANFDILCPPLLQDTRTQKSKSKSSPVRENGVPISSAVSSTLRRSLSSVSDQVKEKDAIQSSDLGEETLAQKAEKFLGDLYSILVGMDDLEELVVSFAPQHPLNPQNVRKDPPQHKDWRTKISGFGSDPSSEEALRERLKKIQSEQDVVLKKSTSVKKSPHEKFKEEADKLNKMHVEQEERDRKRNAYSHNLYEVSLSKGLRAQPASEPASKEDLNKVSDMFSTWFLESCDSNSHIRIDMVSQWWFDLPSQVVGAVDVKSLLRMLEMDRKSPKILTTLDKFVDAYIHFKYQSFYELLRPIYLDVITSFSTLAGVNDEATRVGNNLSELMENKVVFGKLQTALMSSINTEIALYLATIQKSIADEEFKKNTTTAFWQAVSETSSGQIIPFQKSNLEEGKAEKSNLRSVIAGVIKEALEVAFQQATGIPTKKLVYNEKAGAWTVVVGEGSLVSAAATYKLQDDAIAVNVAPIKRYLYDMSYSHFPKLMYPGAPNSLDVIYAPIDEGLQEEWKISQDGSVRKPAEKKELRKVKSKQAHTSVLNSDVKRERKKFLDEIGQFGNWPDTLKEKGVKERKVLREFKEFFSQFIVRKRGQNESDLAEVLKANGRAFIMHDLPGVLTYGSGRTGYRLFEDMRDFLDAYIDVISAAWKSLEEGEDKILSVYLNPERVDIDFLHNPQKKAERVLKIFAEVTGSDILEDDWVQIKKLMKNPPDFSKDASGHYEFTKDVRDLVLGLLRLEKLSKQSKSDNGLDVGSLDIAEFMAWGERLNKFKVRCEECAQGKSLSKSSALRRDGEFESRLLMSTLPVKNAVERLRGYMSGSTLVLTEDVVGDWKIVIKFFKEYFEQTLEQGFLLFNDEGNILSGLKDLYRPILRKSEEADLAAFANTKDFVLIEPYAASGDDSQPQPNGGGGNEDQTSTASSTTTNSNLLDGNGVRGNDGTLVVQVDSLPQAGGESTVDSAGSGVSTNSITLQGSPVINVPQRGVDEGHDSHSNSVETDLQYPGEVYLDEGGPVEQTLTYPDGDEIFTFEGGEQK